MTTSSESFTAEAIQASIRRRLAVRNQPGTGNAWSEADIAVIGQVYSWLTAHKTFRAEFPTTGIAIDGNPDLDWAAITAEQFADQVRGRLSNSPRDLDKVTRTDLRIAIRRRLTDREADVQLGRPALQSEDAKILLDLYEFASGFSEAPDMVIPTDVVFDGHPDIDWGSTTPAELLKLVRQAYTDRGTQRHHTTVRGPEAAAGSTTTQGTRGATVSDAVDETPQSFESFTRQRAERRAAEARILLKARQDFHDEAEHIRNAHCSAANELFSDPSMPQSVRREALRHHRRTMQTELDEHTRVRAETLGQNKPWYHNLLANWQTEHGDRRDYANVIKALYEDRAAARRNGDTGEVKADAVLVLIPGAQRYRRDGATVYAQKTPAGIAEMFRVMPDTREVIVRSTDAVALEAAIVKAYDLDGPPLVFEGSDAFRARCEDIAERHGFAVVIPSEAKSRHSSQKGTNSPASAGSRETATGAEASGTQTADVQSTAPVPDLADYGDIVAFAKEQTGVDFIVALDAKHAVAMEPVYIAHAPMTNDAYDVMIVQKPGVDALSAVAVPRGSVPPAAASGETRVNLQIEHGAWVPMFETPRPARDDLDQTRSRGR